MKKKCFREKNFQNRKYYNIYEEVFEMQIKLVDEENIRGC